MLNIDAHRAKGTQTLSELLGHRHATVFTTGATDGNGGVMLAFTAVAIEHRFESFHKVSDKLFSPGIIKNIITDSLILFARGVPAPSEG